MAVKAEIAGQKAKSGTYSATDTEGINALKAIVATNLVSTGSGFEVADPVDGAATGTKEIKIRYSNTALKASGISDGVPAQTGHVNYIITVTAGDAELTTNMTDENFGTFTAGTTTGNNNNGGGDTNTEAPVLLKDYVLGQAVNGVRPGKDITTILNFSTKAFINDEDTLASASTDVVVLNSYIAEVDNVRNLYVKYNDVAYRILVSYNGTSDAYTTSELVKVYEPDANSNVGKVVKYSVDGTSEPTDWLVLYDNGSTLDIMSLDSMGSFTLGWNDPKSIEALPSGTNLEKAQNSYDNAVSRLNTYCGTLVTNSTAQNVRSVGTQFDITDTTTKYSSTFLANNPTESAGTYNGVAKTGDMNGEQDVVRMSYYSKEGTGSNYTAPGYAASTGVYWLASRCVHEFVPSQAYEGFTVKYVDGGDASGYYQYLWGVSGDETIGPFCDSCTCAVRPVVRVSKGNVSGL